MKEKKNPFSFPIHIYSSSSIVGLLLHLQNYSRFETMTIKMWVKRYNNLFAQKKNKKVHILEILTFWKRTVILPILKSSLQIPFLDDILWQHFTLSNSIILVKDLTRWKKRFEIFLIDQYAGDNGNKNIAGKY